MPCMLLDTSYNACSHPHAELVIQRLLRCRQPHIARLQVNIYNFNLTLGAAKG